MLHNVVILYSKRHNAHRDAHFGLWNKAIIIPYLQLVSHTPIRFGVFCRLILYLRCFVRQYIYIYLNFGYEGGALLGRSALSFLNPLTHRQVQTPHLPNTPAHPPLHKASARCAIRSSLVRSCGTPWDSAGCAISGHLLLRIRPPQSKRRMRDLRTPPLTNPPSTKQAQDARSPDTHLTKPLSTKRAAERAISLQPPAERQRRGVGGHRHPKGTRDKPRSVRSHGPARAKAPTLRQTYLSLRALRSFCRSFTTVAVV